MKKRLAIALSLAIFFIISLPIALVISSIQNHGLFLIIAILGLVYTAIYVFGGLAKLIIYFIYGATTALFLILLPEIYQLPFVFIGTLLFILNPLANFESFLEKQLNEEDVLPMRISIRGSYWPFFAYRREMKNYYHLPQSRKLFTKKWYLYLRQATTLLLLFLGIFLFIHEISSIASAIDTLDPIYFLSFYSVFIFFLLTFILYKKGFTSTFRALSVSIFPVLVFVVLISDLSMLVKLILGIAIFVLGLVISIFELVKYYQRVVYESYHYYDIDSQEEVYANALFEPLVYNEPYRLTATYDLKVPVEVFEKSFHDILVYINYFKMILVSYAIKDDYIYLTCHFHFKQEKRVEKFKTYLESKFKKEVPYTLKDDVFKKEYETKVFHRPDYIIARALYLAHLLKDLEIQSKIIVQMIAYFKSTNDLLRFANEYPCKRMPQIDEQDMLTVKIDLPLINSDFIIESKIREVLLSLMSYHGQYVRINVYY